MKELERPNIEYYYEPDGYDGDSSDYGEHMEKYCDQLEKERDELKEEVRDAEHMELKYMQELQTLKDAVREIVPEIEGITYTMGTNEVPDELDEDNIDKLKELIK